MSKGFQEEERNKEEKQTRTRQGRGKVQEKTDQKTRLSSKQDKVVKCWNAVQGLTICHSLGDMKREQESQVKLIKG